MRRGLFGKVLSKRDFISHGAPRGFLSIWEPWIQGSVASSKAQLGQAWQPGFLTAPIWRFWLGPDVCGYAAIGAFTPSMDGVGRYFPLTIALTAEDGEIIPSPETDPQDAWFGAVEDYLLMTLEQDTSFETIIRSLDSLPDPAGAAPESGAAVLPVGGAVVKVGAEGFARTCRAAREACETQKALASTTFWWTQGGGGYERLAFAAIGMPDFSLFAGMITGRFDARSAANAQG